jgi:hypothetical protein
MTMSRIISLYMITPIWNNCFTMKICVYFKSPKKLLYIIPRIFYTHFILVQWACDIHTERTKTIILFCFDGLVWLSPLLRKYKMIPNSEFTSPNPSRGVHVAEKAHGRSRSSHLKYQRWLVDLSWRTLKGWR